MLNFFLFLFKKMMSVLWSHKGWKPRNKADCQFEGRTQGCSSCRSSKWGGTGMRMFPLDSAHSQGVGLRSPHSKHNRYTFHGFGLSLRLSSMENRLKLTESIRTFTYYIRFLQQCRCLILDQNEEIARTILNTPVIQLQGTLR